MALAAWPGTPKCVCSASAWKARSGPATLDAIPSATSHGERPRKRRQEAAYFTNDELPVLFERSGSVAPRTACCSNWRQRRGCGRRTGGATWGDDSVHSVIHVRRTYTDGTLGSPKNHEKREMFVTEEIVDLLGSWWGLVRQARRRQARAPRRDEDRLPQPAGDLLGRRVVPGYGARGHPRGSPLPARNARSTRYATRSRDRDRAQPARSSGSPSICNSLLDVTSNVYGHFEKATRKRRPRRWRECSASDVPCGVLTTRLARPRDSEAFC